MLYHILFEKLHTVTKIITFVIQNLPIQHFAYLLCLPYCTVDQKASDDKHAHAHTHRITLFCSTVIPIAFTMSDIITTTKTQF